jgi:hypothetical protein
LSQLLPTPPSPPPTRSSPVQTLTGASPAAQSTKRARMLAWILLCI